LSYQWENCRNIGGASYSPDIRKFEKKVDAFANVVWWFTHQQIFKRIGQSCFRTVLHGFLIDKLLETRCAQMLMSMQAAILIAYAHN
jgi:hypothetical protein